MVALPFLLILSFKKKYKDSIPAKFFLLNNPPFKKEGIWFHACSLGEVNSLKPIFDELQEDINLSVITQTGYKSAKEKKGLHVRYLPFELFLPFWVKKQRVLVVTEAELWPMLFIVAKLKGAKTILINARISDKSYNSYKKFNWFYRWLFSYIDEVLAQSEVDKKRLEEIGAKKVIVNGNIKTIAKPKVTKSYEKPQKRVITIASSHEGEEELILKNLKLKKDDTLLVVPRHPERFGSVEKFLREFAKKRGLSFAKIEDGLKADIILCDKMGELINLYKISDIVLLCGSFVDKIGGHNPLEPAFFGCRIISGEYFFNQKPLFSLVENLKVCRVEDLKDMNFDDIKPSKILHVGDKKTLINRIKDDRKSI